MTFFLIFSAFYLGGLVHALALEFSGGVVDETSDVEKFVGALVWPYDVYQVVRNHMQR